MEERSIHTLQESFNTEQARLMGERLNTLGLMNGAGTIQVDIAAATYNDRNNSNVGSDKPLCDTNCGPEGGYTCPARRLANAGLSTKGLAPADKIIQGFLVSAEGLRIFNQRFVANGSLDNYCKMFSIPENVKNGIAYNLLQGKVTANIFGGNAEMHPQALKIAKACHEAGMTTNLTTTSGILLSDSPKGQAFLKGSQEGFVDVLAVTGEFEDAAQVKKLTAMTAEALKAERNRIPFYLGQPRKGIAAAHAGILQNNLPHFPQLLFNVVVHPGNVKHIETILDAMKEAFPYAQINPYFAQSSMYNEPPIFSEEHIPALQAFIHTRLEEQRIQNSYMRLRPHYYAMLAAVFDTYTDDPTTVIRMLSGNSTWKCYENPYGIAGAGRVIQVGASPEIRDLRVDPDAGGKLNCFWNDNTILRKGKKVWDMQSTEVADHIGGGMQIAAQDAENPCPGCIMPRLTGDIVSQELGLNPLLQQGYLEQRKQIVGF